MIEITKFEYIFNTEECYKLTLPTIFKLYLISNNSDIKLAILSLISNLYTIHKENFIFQMLEAQLKFESPSVNHLKPSSHIHTDQKDHKITGDPVLLEYDPSQLKF